MSLTDIPGVLVGHASDYEALTGCTAILFPEGAVAGFDIRGAASGTEEFGVLSPLHVTQRIHGVCLAGGSAFGLEAVSGVRRHLESEGIGYEIAGARVPLVAGAILFDLGVGNATVRPSREMGIAAAEAATAEPVQEGAVGAGTGATVGKLHGMSQAMKSGIGTATVELTGNLAGIRVSALAAVNAVGDVRDPATGEIVSGARIAPDSFEFIDSAATMLSGPRSGQPVENTTLVVVVTNAGISKVEATRLAQMAGLGMARTISPVWTSMDGDLIIAASTGSGHAPVDSLGSAAAEAVALAIVRAARLAPTLGGVPGFAR